MAEKFNPKELIKRVIGGRRKTQAVGIEPMPIQASEPIVPSTSRQLTELPNPFAGLLYIENGGKTVDQLTGSERQDLFMNRFPQELQQKTTEWFVKLGIPSDGTDPMGIALVDAIYHTYDTNRSLTPGAVFKDAYFSVLNDAHSQRYDAIPAIPSYSHTEDIIVEGLNIEVPVKPIAHRLTFTNSHVPVGEKYGLDIYNAGPGTVGLVQSIQRGDFDAQNEIKNPDLNEVFKLTHTTTDGEAHTLYLERNPHDLGSIIDLRHSPKEVEELINNTQIGDFWGIALGKRYIAVNPLSISRTT